MGSRKNPGREAYPLGARLLSTPRIGADGQLSLSLSLCVLAAEAS